MKGFPLYGGECYIEFIFNCLGLAVWSVCVSDSTPLLLCVCE